MRSVSDSEANRWYNQLSAKANFNHWLKLECWRLDEAVILSMGRDPSKVSWDSIVEYVEISRVAKELQRRRLLVE